jgi:uncharacterized protein (DUF983 family)
MTPSRSKLISTALARGLRKRCPHCGEGRLFSGWAHLERCSICGLAFERNPGDTWFFTIIGNRVPIFVIVVLIYLGIALHYLSRVYWPDPADPVPPPLATAPGKKAP